MRTIFLGCCAGLVLTAGALPSAGVSRAVGSNGVSAIECPSGTNLLGAAPPAGLGRWCTGADGTRHGPAEEWIPRDVGNGIQETARWAGQYENDKKEGVWRLFGPDGKLAVEGAFKNGVRDGAWRWGWLDGAQPRVRFEETFSEGRPAAKERGDCTDCARCPAGTVLLGAAPPHGDARWCEMLDGRKHGPYYAWWSREGVLGTSGSYHHDLEDGRWEYWHPNGKKQRVSNFVKGKHHGRERRWRDNGRLEMDATFVNGLMSGRAASHHATGGKAAESTWRAGKRHGAIRRWYPSGARLLSGSYRDGQQHGVWTHWAEDGKVLERGTYASGRLASGTAVSPGENDVDADRRDH